MLVKLAQVVLRALVGACAGAAAGVIIVGFLGGLTGILSKVAHTNPKDDPFTEFLAGAVIFGFHIGLPLGAPVGAVVGLVSGMILGIRSCLPRGATACKPAVPHDDDFSTAALPPGKGSSSTASLGIGRSCGLVVVTALAIPGALLLLGGINGWREKAAFDRFAAEVAKSWGRATVVEAAVWSGRIELVEVTFAGMSTSDADLERITRIGMFDRVHSLSLARTSITDRGVALLAGHPNIMRLDLSRTAVTDQGLASIARIGPSNLNLSGTRITDGALQILKEQAVRFPNRTIDLTDTKFDFCRFDNPTGARTAIDEAPRGGVSDRVWSVKNGLL